MRSISILLLSAIIISASTRTNAYALMNYQPYQETYSLESDKYNYGNNDLVLDDYYGNDIDSEEYYNEVSIDDQVSGPPGSLGYNAVGRVNVLLNRFNKRMLQLQSALRNHDQTMANQQYYYIPRLLTRIEKRAHEIENPSIMEDAFQKIGKAYRKWEKERTRALSSEYNNSFSFEDQYSGFGNNQFQAPTDKAEQKRLKLERKNNKQLKKQKKAEEQIIKRSSSEMITAKEAKKQAKLEKQQKEALRDQKSQRKAEKEARKQAKLEKKQAKVAMKEWKQNTNYQ